MPPPIPVPSKAAIHALRGIAFGTSCAIGVIVEDRRRRIDILRTAVSNGEIIKSIKRYHRIPDVALPFDERDDPESIETHQRQLEDKPNIYRKPKKYTDFTSDEEPPQQDSISTEPKAPLKLQNVFESSRSRNADQLKTPKTKSDVQSISVHESSQESSQVGVASAEKDRSDNAFVRAINGILRSNDEEKIDRALTKFFEGSRLYHSFTDIAEWVAVSAELSKACQAESRFDDAGKVLATTVSTGSLDNSQYYAHDPFPILEFYLRQVDSAGRCLREATAVATHIFLARFKEKSLMYASETESFGRRLFAYNISINQPSVIHHIYWRIVGCVENPTNFTGWALRELYSYKDYKSVIRYFLLNYSKMSPTTVCYNLTLDCVIGSVKALKGTKAKEVLKALVRLKRPDEGLVRTQWIIKALYAYWHRDEDFLAVKALFEEISSEGVLDMINHPQAVYRTMIEISIKAKEDDLARSYCEVLFQKHPEMLNDVALRGFMALATADAGDWDGVFDTFTEMQALKKGQEVQYDNAFVMVLKTFAETHPATEVRDFVSKYTTDLGVRMHRYAITLVANKYGECHDVSGFISWLTYCCKAGFALDSRVCNSILHNCWTIFKLSYPELLKIYSSIQQLGPSLTDSVTRRIMSQAALTTGKGGRRSNLNRGVHSRVTRVDKLAYTGRTANQRDVYEAMNQELHAGKPAIAISIYKRALDFGMPSCQHCLRLAVVAASRSPKHGTNCAMSFIQTAHTKGTDITSAVAAFIKLQLEQIQASSHDLLIHMRNLVGQFEAINIVVQPSVLTHMAIMVINLGHFERGIALCTFAMNQNGSKNLCFSRQSIRALLNCYSKLRDAEGMKKLCRDILESKYVADKCVLQYLKSARRVVSKFKEQAVGDAMLGILQDTISQATKQRAETRAKGAMIAEETLRIMQEAALDMRKYRKIPNTPTDLKPGPPRIWPPEDEDPRRDSTPELLDKSRYL
ncbi:hypothetical protein F4781DRAFT_409235 [Annulohypoxylon bovei var. microspora]|nr:hypothetical protein F4781DRAFT_409235 [Annulohypoxylon bovei var. microspora]